MKLSSFPVSPGRVLHKFKVDKPSHMSAFTQRDGTQRTQHHLNGFVPTQISEEEKVGLLPEVDQASAGGSVRTGEGIAHWVKGYQISLLNPLSNVQISQFY